MLIPGLEYAPSSALLSTCLGSLVPLLKWTAGRLQEGKTGALILTSQLEDLEKQAAPFWKNRAHPVTPPERHSCTRQVTNLEQVYLRLSNGQISDLVKLSRGGGLSLFFLFLEASHKLCYLIDRGGGLSFVSGRFSITMLLWR